jgi:hypothetical protein
MDENERLIFDELEIQRDFHLSSVLFALSGNGYSKNAQMRSPLGFESEWPGQNIQEIQYISLTSILSKHLKLLLFFFQIFLRVTNGIFPLF